MDNGEKKVSDLFDGKNIFNIPEYQRAYAWGPQQLSEFIDDIHNQKLDHKYFLGTVLFEEQHKEGSYNIIDIVDGQQRLTTIIIFMSALISRLKELCETEEEEEDLELLYETYIKHKKQYKLRALEEDNEFFHTYILGERNGLDFILTSAQRRLHQARVFFAQELSLLDKKTLLEMKSKIDDNSRILVYSVQDTAEATLIFETTNDRGKTLTNLEKIKSFYMYKTYVASEGSPDQLLTKIRTRFSDIYKEHEKFSCKMDENSIMQYHFIGHELWLAKEYQHHIQAVKNSINNQIANGNNEQALAHIERYTRELKETFLVTHAIFNCEIPAFRDLLYLRRLGNFWPLLIRSWKLDGYEDKRQFARIARLLEIFIFRVYVINQNRSNTGQTTFFDLALRFSGDFDGLAEAIIELINKYSKNKQFSEHLGKETFYSWLSKQDLNYFFWKYENFLRETENPATEPMTEQELTVRSKLKMTVAHIASCNPKSTVVDDLSILPVVDANFEENHLHRIGNLTIDSPGTSASDVREPFKIRKELGSYLENEQWTANSIAERTRQLVKFALDHWAAK